MLHATYRGPSRPRQGARPRAHPRRGPASRGHASPVVSPVNRLPAVAALRAGARPLGLRHALSAPGREPCLVRCAPCGRTTSRPSAPALSRSPLPSSGAKRLTPLWGLIGLLHVVKSDRATRARYSNPAGPPLRSGLAQEGLRRAVKVADREVGLTRTSQDLACGAPAPEARGRRVGPALPNRPAHGRQHPEPCQDEPS